MSKPNPTFYAILTADVRYDPALTSTAKLLYAEITALAQADGFCWASNNYFAKLYGISPKHVSELVTSLVGQGHVVIEVDKAGGNKRYIRLAQAIRLIPGTYPEKSGYPYPEKSGDNNNTSTNTKINISAVTDFERETARAYALYLKHFIVNTTDILTLDDAKKRYRLTPGRRAKLIARFKDAKPNMVYAAIVGYGKTPWYRGENDRHWKADLAEYICRSYENLEKGARLYEDLVKHPVADDEWAKLSATN